MSQSLTTEQTKGNEPQEKEPEFVYPVWDDGPAPGQRGFNAHATATMRKYGLGTTVPLRIACPGKEFFLQAYQETVKFLVHPGSPIHRFLVLHRTGSGKTLTMVQVLENFFDDPRPKVVIFPNTKVQNNFYQQLMMFPNKYRDYVLARHTSKTKPPSLKKVTNVLAMTGELRHAGEPGYLKAPLRAVRYTIAGGKQVFRKEGPRNPLFKIMYDGRNPYTNKIVLMDEFHNLVNPDMASRRFEKNLAKVRHALRRAEHAVVVGFTATPIQYSSEDSEALLRIVRGREYANAPLDEGFISSFQTMPLSVYPQIIPGNPTKIWPCFISVPLEGLNLQRYNTKQREFERKFKLSKRMHKLLNFCCMAQSYRATLKRFAHVLKTDAPSAASKLAAVVKDVLGRQDKTIILIHREDGFKALQLLFQQRAKEAKYGSKTCSERCWLSLYDKPTRRDEALLRIFNSRDNANGQLIQTVLLDAKWYSEGVSFLGVQRLILVDMPESWGSYKQRIGRVLRFCGHRYLPRDKWHVRIDIYMARHPDPHVQTADEFFWRQMDEGRAEIIDAMDDLDRVAVDHEVLHPLMVALNKHAESTAERACPLIEERAPSRPPETPTAASPPTPKPRAPKISTKIPTPKLRPPSRPPSPLTPEPERKRMSAPSGLSVEADLGKGFYGSVQLVKDRQTRTLFVRKTIPFPNEQYRLLFQRERMVLTRLKRHGCKDYFICLHDSSSTPEQGVLLFDHIPNSYDMDRFIKENLDQLNWTQRFVVVHRALKALFRLHQLKIVHRDMKPTNMLIHPGTLRVFLIDFGLSCIFSDFPCYFREAAGTKLFMDPKMTALFLDPPDKPAQVSFQDNMANDLWGLGVSLELLFAKPNHVFFLQEIRSPETHRRHLERFYQAIPGDNADIMRNPIRKRIVLNTLPILRDLFTSIFLERQPLREILRRWRTYEERWVQAIYDAHHKAPEGEEFVTLKQAALLQAKHIRVTQPTQPWGGERAWLTDVGGVLPHSIQRRRAKAERHTGTAP